MAIQFIVDSASDLTPEEAALLGVIHMPLTVSFGEEEYFDTVTLSHDDFYKKLIESDTLPKTSQIPVYRFTEVFTRVTQQGDTAIVILLSSELSGTYQSACLAASEFPEGQIHIIDSENVCVGERVLLQRGLELLKMGLEAEKIVEQLNQEKKSIRVLALLDTLEYLKKGGRISAAAAIAGGILSLKPVIAVKNGKIEMAGKARGSKKGNNLLRELIQAGNGIDFDRPHCAAYSGLSDHLLQKYIEDSADLWQTNVYELPVTTIGCAIGTHVGPGTIGVAFFEKDE